MRDPTSSNRYYPRAIFLVLLLLIFTAETVTMLIIKWLFAHKSALWLEILVDASLLTLMCTPFIWRLIVVPLKKDNQFTASRAQAVLDTAAEGIITIDQSGHVLSFNKAAERIFGYSATEMLGQNVNQLMTSPQREEHDNYIARYLASGQGMIVGRSTELKGQHKDGSVIPLRLAISETINSEQKIFTGIVTDLRLQQQTEQKFRTIFNSANDAILILDQTGHFLEVNDIACERLGYSRAELRHMTLQDIDTPEYAGRINERVTQLQQQGWLLAETAHVSKDGRIIPTEISSRIIEYEGKPAFLTIARDISKRKQIEAALHESQSSARVLLDINTESAMLLSCDGEVLAINQTGAQRFGKSIEELTGKNIYAFMPADVAASRKQRVAETLQSGKPMHFEDRRDGLYFESALYPIEDLHGRISKLAVFAREVTQARQRQAVDTLLHEIDQLVLQYTDFEHIQQHICNKLTELFDLEMAWIGHKEADGSIRINCYAGRVSDYKAAIEQIGIRWDNTPLGKGPSGMAIRTGQVNKLAISDFPYPPWRDCAIKHGLASMIALPLIIRGQIYGALSLYSARTHAFDDEQMLQRLSDISSRICITLEMAQDQEQLHLLSAALATAGNAIFITDNNGRIVWLNQAFTELSGYSHAEVLGHPPRILNSGMHPPDYYEHLWSTISAGEVWNSETTERSKTGQLYTVQQTITPISDGTGHITHYISIQEDITAQKQAEARIHHMAHHDMLTDLPNRALFQDRLQQAIYQSTRNNHKVALLFLDLDHFKSINDTLGHDIGDQLLICVAKRLCHSIRESDSIARLGGDEFTVILPLVHATTDAILVAEKITQALAQPFPLGKHEIHTSASIGVALFPDDANNAENLIKMADTAMYQAKNSGRNAFRLVSHALPTP